MFELYTEKARRTVFFARYEASQFGSRQIETEHLLLGALREDPALANRLLASRVTIDSLRTTIAGRGKTRPQTPTTVDLPISSELQRALTHSAEERERLSLKHIGTDLLVLGLLLEEKCFAARLMREQGITKELLRELVARQFGPRSETGRPVWIPAFKQWVAEREADCKWTVEQRAVVNEATGNRTTHFALYASDEPKGIDEDQDPAPASQLARTRKRIDLAAKQMQRAIANHDFERARHFSDEEGKERDHLQQLCEQFNLAAPPRQVPLVCIAVIDDDLFWVLRRRCERYIEEGVAEVWLLDPSLRRAYTVTKADGLREFKGEILQIANAHLEMDVRKIFENPSLNPRVALPESC